MFKVGDWVRYINGKNKTTAQVKIINQISNYIGVSTGENVHIDDCEPWQPQEGEWCWIFDSLLENPILVKYKGYNEIAGLHVGYAISKLYEIEKQGCEPFIGELPSFLKD